MPTVRFEFDEVLNALLPIARRHNSISTSSSGPQTVKHLIETLRIPHTEVLKVTSAGRDVALDSLAQDNDVLLVHGIISESLSSEPAFVLDGHLGRLAAGLRMLGFDCAYQHQPTDLELVQIGMLQKRLLVTRDRRLLMRNVVRRGYLVRSQVPDEQLYELCSRYQLLRWLQPFRRCIRCNATLRPAAKKDVADRLLPLTRLYYEDFRSCPNCLQPYWKGSHLAAMQYRIDRIVGRLQDSMTQAEIPGDPPTSRRPVSGFDAML